MKVKDKKIFLIFVIGVLFLLITTSALAYEDLAGKLIDSIDVTIHVDPYAQVEGGNINSDDWIEFEGPKEDSIIDRLNENDDLSPTTGEGFHFSGKGGEVRWARNDLMIGANVPFSIHASATYPKDSEGNLMVADNEDRVFYSYLVSQDTMTSIGMITPSNDIFLTGFSVNCKKRFILASKVMMPDDFWQVKSGSYVGTVTFTVTAD